MQKTIALAHNNSKLMFEFALQLNNWLIGLNWNKATHEVEGASYFSIHLLCFHIVYWRY